MVMICVENIQLLIERNREDVDALDLIEDCLNSFDEYHAKITEWKHGLSCMGITICPKTITSRSMLPWIALEQ